MIPAGASVDIDRDRMVACLDMLGRTGARNVEIRWSDDPLPVVWIALALWRVSEEGRPIPPRDGEVGEKRYQAAAAMHPNHALERLLELALDGGRCAHCQRPTGVTHDFEGEVPGREWICWYRWDPELKTYRRSCEGD